MAASGASTSTGLEPTEPEELAVEAKCVFCQTSDGCLKVLLCLHVACLSCVVDHVEDNNSIQCANCRKVTPDPGQFQKLADWLPNWPAPEAEPFQAICEDSDCEEFAEPAKARCLDCRRTLCEAHGFTHIRQKQTRGHRIVPLVSSATDASCPIHQPARIEHYCSTCRALLCSRCLSKSSHSGHEMETVEAACQELTRAATSSVEASEPLLTTVSQTIDGNADLINQETVKCSQDIEDDFKEAANLLQARQDELRLQLDKTRWKVSMPLEKKKEEVEELLRQHKTTRYLFKHLDNIAVLRLGSNGGFKDTPADEVKRLAASVPPSGLGVNYTRMNDQERDVLTDLGAIGSQSAKQAIPAAPPKLSAAAEIVCKPYCDQFDPGAKSDIIKLSNRNRTATCTHSDLRSLNVYSVCGVGFFMKGEVTVSLRIGGTNPYLFIGFTKPSAPICNKSWKYDVMCTFPGWASVAPATKHTTGGALGQPWESGDIITLTLASNRNKLTAVHDRTGARDTISVLSCPLRFHTVLLRTASVCLLSPVNI